MTAPSPRPRPAWSAPPAAGPASRWDPGGPRRNPPPPPPAPPSSPASTAPPTWRPACATALKTVGHRRPLLHPAPRHRAGRVRGPDRLAGRRHLAAGGHVRRRDGRPHRRRPRRGQAGRRPAGLRGPRGPGPVGPAAAGRAGQRAHPDHGHLGPGRIRHRRAAVRPGGLLRRRHLPGDRLRRAHRQHGLQAGQPRPTTPASSSPVAKTAKNKTSKGGRKYALRRLNERGTATQEIVGVGHRPEDDGNDRPLLQQFIKNGELLPGWTGPEGVAARPAAARRFHGRTAGRGPPAAARRAGHPDHLRGKLRRTDGTGPDHR